MNWDTVQGKWKQMTGKVKEQWGDLTDDEITKTEGRWEEFTGLLQEKYGMTREAASDAANNFMQSVAGTANDMTDEVKDRMNGEHTNGADGQHADWHKIEGQWQKLKGSFMENWGKMTDDELMQSEGRRDHLAGMLQSKYGVSKEEAERMLNDWASKHGLVGGGAR